MDDEAEIERFQKKLQDLEPAMEAQQIVIANERLEMSTAVAQAMRARDEQEATADKDLQDRRRKIEQIRKVISTLSGSDDDDASSHDQDDEKPEDLSAVVSIVSRCSGTG